MAGGGLAKLEGTVAALFTLVVDPNADHSVIVQVLNAYDGTNGQHWMAGGHLVVDVGFTGGGPGSLGGSGVDAGEAGLSAVVSLLVGGGGRGGGLNLGGLTIPLELLRLDGGQRERETKRN